MRSNTILNLLKGRSINRFVIDEAHCFSAWGQDFRVDYLYIADFILKLQKEKKHSQSIPVSCFTATAKPAVIKDVLTYFKEKIRMLFEKGYHVAHVKVGYIIIWKDKEDMKNYRVVLPDIILKKGKMK